MTLVFALWLGHSYQFLVFMLQADVLENMGFSTTRKRLIHSHDCSLTSNFDKNEGIISNNSNELEAESDEL